MKKIIFGIVAVIMTLGMLVSCNFTSDIGSEGILLKSVLEGMGNFQCSIIIYSFYIFFFVLSNVFPCFRKAFCVFCKTCRGKRLCPSPLFVAIYSSFSSGSGI